LERDDGEEIENEKENLKMKHLSRIGLQGTYNTRDLGGYVISGGYMTRWHRIFRSDDVAYLTENDFKVLESFKVKTVIDLRSPGEIKVSPNQFSSMEHIDYHHISLINRENYGLNDKDDPKDALKAMYIYVLNHEKDAVLKVLHTIAEAKEGAILYHCIAGKDRTGIISMLLLGLSGVDDQDIVSNYEITYTNVRRNPRLANMPYEVPEYLIQSHYQNMEETIAYIKKEYNSFESYIKHIGLRDELIQAIKQRLVEPI